MDKLDKETKLYKIRHSLAHILAQAVQKLYPNVILGFGPPINTGFYYDFDFGKDTISLNDFKKIEKEMRKIIAQNQEFSRFSFDESKALDFLKRHNNGKEKYKIENVHKLIKQEIKEFSFYQNGDFVDLCKGPHVKQTKELSPKCFKLDRIAGAYWLGNEKNKSLTRIYALCFEGEEELKQFIKKREIAEKFSHHKLGQELELFSFDTLIGKGLPLWLPKGTVIKDCIQQYAEEIEFKYGYQRVSTPHIAKEELYLTSQHLPAYKESMFPTMIDEKENTRWYLKPMNCPHHHLIYKSKPRSYKDLPLRLAEYGSCYRYEQSGELSGLLRVRSMTMNDGHIYLAHSQIKKEFHSIMQMYLEFYETFKLKDYSFRLSIRGEQNKDKFEGDPKIWSEAENILEEILKELKLNYEVGEGEAAFYGPKIDIQFKNLMGREETVSTIQIDYLSPQNFKLKFINENNQEDIPVIIHRAPLSTHERFISFIIEYYGGAFPLWCSPTQITILPVNNNVLDYCQNLKQYLFEKQFRVEFDTSTNSFGKKIRIHTTQKVPIILIIGDNELKNKTVTIRRYGEKIQETIEWEEFVRTIKKERSRRLMKRKPLGTII